MQASPALPASRPSILSNTSNKTFCVSMFLGVFGLLCAQLGQAAAPFALSLTQQLFLADRFVPRILPSRAILKHPGTKKSSAQDRFDLLAEDRDFVFEFNRSSATGAAGTIVTANRKSFPALVGTGSSMAIGWVGRAYLFGRFTFFEY